MDPADRVWSSSTSGCSTGPACGPSSPAPAATSSSRRSPACSSASCAACVLDRAELVTLVAVLAGSALAGWVMVAGRPGAGPARPPGRSPRRPRRHPPPERPDGRREEPLRRVSGRGPGRPDRRLLRDHPAAPRDADLRRPPRPVGSARRNASRRRASDRLEGTAACHIQGVTDRDQHHPARRLPGGPEYLEQGGGSPGSGAAGAVAAAGARP